MAKKVSQINQTNKPVMTFKVTMSDHTGAVRGKPYRVIGMQGTESLEKFAEIIVHSFDFDFDHCFGFYDNIKNHYNSKKGYELFADIGEDSDFPGVRKTLVRDVFGVPKEKWLFLFDYGDEWHFIVEYKGMTDVPSNKKLPAILEIHMDALPQYEYEDDDYDYENEDEDEDDEDEDVFGDPEVLPLLRLVEKTPVESAPDVANNSKKLQRIPVENVRYYLHLENALEAFSYYLLNPVIFGVVKDLMATYMAQKVRVIQQREMPSYAAAFLHLVFEVNDLYMGQSPAVLNALYPLFDVKRSAVDRKVAEIANEIGSLKPWQRSGLNFKNTNLVKLSINSDKRIDCLRGMILERYDVESDLMEIPHQYGKRSIAYKPLMSELETLEDYYDGIDEHLDADDYDDEDIDPNSLFEMLMSGNPSQQQKDDLVQVFEDMLKGIRKEIKKELKEAEKGTGIDLWYTEDREYIGFCMGLINVYNMVGQFEKALDLIKHLLKISPCDGVGARYMALPLAALCKDFVFAEKLVKEMDEPSAMWLYGVGLYQFAAGQHAEAEKTLVRAIKENKFVPPYLNGSRKPPDGLPDAYSPGSQAEAMLYYVYANAAWSLIPGAIAFLNQVKKGK